MAVRALHLCVLWAFAIVAPLLDELGRHAEFFVVRGNTRADILIVAVGLTLVPPLVLSLLVALAARIRPRAGDVLQAVLVGLLLAVFALDLLQRIMSATVPLLIAAMVLGAAGAVAYALVAPARSFLTALSPAPVVFLVAFLLFSPVKELLQGSAEAASGGLRSDTPVVLVIFDELPTTSLMDAGGQIDGSSFPSFARLARTSTWYRNATTVADGTQLAVPSILSGQRPTSDLPTARRYPDNIFTLLGEHYDLHVLEPITRVCGACDHPRSDDPGAQRLGSLLSDLAIVEGHLLLPRGLASGLAPIDRDFEDFGGQEAGVEAPAQRTPARERSQRSIAGDDLFADRLRDAERFVREVRRPGPRTPAFVAHFVVPHVPWRLLPSGRQYPVEGPSLPGSVDHRWTADRFLVQQATQRHTLQVAYADRLLGRLVAKLKSAGVWDDAIVVVTADHGIGLRPKGSRREIVHDDFPAIAGVPLFIKRPRQRVPRIADQPARSIDVVPTIASVLGARDRAKVDGTPLAARHRTTSGTERLQVRHGRTGKLVSMGFDAFVRARDAELARQRRSFPGGLRELFRIGPNQRLLGRRVRPLAVGDDAARVHINDDDAFAFVDHRSGVVPVYVTGYFKRNLGTGIPLAVAVNGRIVAVGASYYVRDMTRFSLLVPPGSLRHGANAIEVFQVSAGRLLRLGRAPG